MTVRGLSLILPLLPFGLLSLGAATAPDPIPLSPTPTVAESGEGDGRFTGLASRGAEIDTTGPALHRFLDSLWEWRLEHHPETATFVGRTEYDDRWTDWTPAAVERRAAVLRAQLERLEAFDAEELDPDDRLNLALALRDLRTEVEGDRFPSELLPVDQMDGIQKTIPAVFQAMPAARIEDLENHVARLRGVETLLDQEIALMRRGIETGVVHARIPLRDVPSQIDALLPDDSLESPLLAGFRERPPAVPATEWEALREQAVRAFRERARPAYLRLREFVVEEYLPAARTESVGWSAVPDGEAWYRHRIRRMTTTDLTPREIHEIGLREVARIRAEMEAIVEEVEFDGTFSEFLEFLRTDPRFYHETPEALLAGYRDIAKRADPGLVRLFGHLPRLQYGVEPVPAYAERSETTARYRRGSLEAGRPGTFLANTYDLSSRPRWEMEALTLHEAVPGHHLQIAIAQELEGLPEFRRFSGPTAFVEGWALYAETLGDELGMYTDPFDRFGALTYQMWRAVRLVVDTGIHSMGWSRDRAIEYFLENSSKPEHDVVVEVDRYIVWPGQALAYMLGKLKIEELRDHAERTLGSEFDLRAFHDMVLGAGALPLDILDERVRTWVAREGATGGDGRD